MRFGRHKKVVESAHSPAILSINAFKPTTTRQILGTALWPCDCDNDSNCRDWENLAKKLLCHISPPLSTAPMSFTIRLNDRGAPGPARHSIRTAARCIARDIGLQN